VNWTLFARKKRIIYTRPIELLKNKMNSLANKTELRQKIDFHKGLNKQLHYLNPVDELNKHVARDVNFMNLEK
jgi:hypothetical protein